MNKIDLTNIHSQHEAVVEHLKRFGHIERQEAEDAYGITRLAAIIYNIKNKDGLEVETKLIPCRDRFGTKKKTADYYLVEQLNK